MKRLRTDVLKLSQSKMAEALRIDQSAVSRWDSGETKPSYAQMEAIRKLAKKTGVDWRDEFFFSVAKRPRKPRNRRPQA